MMSLLATGCPNAPEQSSPPHSPTMVSRGMIAASFTRYVDIELIAPFEQFDLTGTFVRYDADKTLTVDSLFDNRSADVELSLDSCAMPARVLETTPHHNVAGDTPIELLDVGNLSVAFSRIIKPIPTRTFPDLLRMIVGVMYTSDEVQGVHFRPGETYTLSASGTVQVSPFRVSLDAPGDLGDVTVDGIMPGDQLPFIRRGEDVELTWEGEGNGDELIATLTWMSMDTPWSLTCKMRDDGVFVIPAAVTAGIPDPLTCSDEEFTVSRVRQMAFRSAGLSSGSFRFVVTTVFPVTF
ncbi:MAG: hypothetical protein QNJ97_14100 [Myxococcota bacterium]|nr:hypothetical protein [Myxococcota bacterium]